MRARRGPMAVIVALALPLGCREHCPEDSLPGLCAPHLRTVGAGGVPRDAILVDLDGDGREELIAAIDGGHTIVVVWGDGRIESGWLLGDVTPIALETADFDGDGRDDVVALDGAAPQIAYFTVDASAQFTVVHSVEIGGSPRGLWAGDLDGDGLGEVVTVDGEGAGLIVIDGAERVRRAFPAGEVPVAFTIADVDGDGLVDAVVADFLGAFQILRGLGDGTFTAPESIAAGLGLVEVAAGDLDGDGLLDLAGRAAAVDELWIHRGAAASAAAESIRTGGDLVPGEGLAIFDASKGDGGVMLPVTDALRTWFVADPPTSPVGARLGGDGLHARLFPSGDRWLTAGYYGIAALESEVAPLFVERWWSPFPTEIAGAPAALSADFDGDGLRDLALFVRPPIDYTSFDEYLDHKDDLDLHVLRGGGEGGPPGFGAAIRWAIPNSVYSVIDVEGDHRDDLVGVNEDGLWILRSSGVADLDVTIPESAIALDHPATQVLPLRTSGGARIILTTPGEARITEVRLDPGGAMMEELVLDDAIETTRVIAAAVGDDPGEALVILGRVDDVAVIAATGADGHLGPLHEVAPLTGWTVDPNRLDLGAGALDEEDEVEVFVASTEGIARIRDLHGDSPVVVIEPVGLDPTALAEPGTILIADVDGDGARDLFRGSTLLDEVVRGDGAGLIGPSSRIDVAGLTRARVELSPEGDTIEAWTYAHRALANARLEVRAAPRLGARWGLPSILKRLEIASLQGAGPPIPTLISQHGVSAWIDVEADRLAAWSPGSTSISDAAVVDFDRDGRDELLLATRVTSPWANASAPHLLVILRWVDGRWVDEPWPTPADLAELPGVTAMRVADLDGDGREDLLVTTPSEDFDEVDVHLALGLGAGEFGPLQEIGGGGSRSLTIGDIDEDGRLEVLTTGYLGSTLLWRRGDEDWTRIALATPSAWIEPGSLLVGEEQALWRRPAGTGELGEPILLVEHPLLRIAPILARGDLDGDGEADVVTGNYDISIWLARDGGLDHAKTIFLAPSQVAIVDVDGGGRADLVLAHSSSAEFGPATSFNLTLFPGEAR